jgi:hypothetical protein
MVKTILITACLLLGGCASCPPPAPKLHISPPLLVAFTVDEIMTAKPSMTQKVADYVTEVVGYIRKVNALPCVSPVEKGPVK